MTELPERRAVIYCRTAFGGQWPLDGQQQLCQELATELGWTVVAVCRDINKEGLTFEGRPGWDEAVTALRSGSANALIVYELDRISRNSALLGTTLKEFAERRITVATTKYGPLKLDAAFHGGAGWWLGE